MSDISIKSLSDIIGWAEGKNLVLPDLQRDYVWGKDQWRRLWEDILVVFGDNLKNEAEDKCPQHFMGVLTMKKNDDSSYAVLDGQQRLTTISVLLDYLSYAKDKKERGLSSLNFFQSKIDYVQNPLSNDEKSKYLEIYRYFMDCHYDMDYGHTEELYQIVMNRLFFMFKVTEENENEVFEKLNACGKNLEFSDLLLNHLMEQGISKTEIKEKWNNLISKVNGLSYVPEGDGENEDEEDDIEERHVDDSDVEENDCSDAVITNPLKLKKFLNAVNSITLPENEAIRESIVGFDLMVERLGSDWFGVYKNQTSDPLSLIESLEKWERLYSYIVEPGKWDETIESKSYARELYYLSIWNVTAYIPVIMRILYRNLEETDNRYEDDVVKNLLKAILISTVHTRIILNRKHTEDRNIEKKIKLIDYILDAYRRKIGNSSYGVNEAELFGIFPELPDVLKNLRGKAEECIRSYQYNSAGSKFLLALYVDKEGSPCSEVQRIEKSQKAQVEHMVPQNLEKGTFEDYGYDVGSIGLIDNLILLSGEANRKISNSTPENKIDEWCADEFGKKFVNESLKESFEKCKGDFKKTQRDKVVKIIEKFKFYFHENQYSGLKKAQSYTFAKKINDNNTKRMKECYNAELINGNLNEIFLRINAGKYEENPSNKDNDTINYFYKGEQKSYKCFDVIKCFIEGVSGNNLSAFYEWISSCEDTIQNSPKLNGSSFVTSSDRTFKYSQKMIHTVDFFERTKIEKNKVMGRVKKGQKQEIYSDKIEICNDFVIDEIIKTLRAIRENCHINRELFDLWVERQRKIPVIVDGVLIQTEYVNVGDEELYNSWIKEKYKEKFNKDEVNDKIENQNQSFVVADDSIYFKVEQKGFKKISELQLVIPEYQRRYVWDENNWKDLCNQLESSNVYLGTIVLREEGDKCYIVDGQQRLTTLAMIRKCLQGNVSENIDSLLENRPLEKFRGFVEKYGTRLELDCCFDVIFVGGPAKYQYDVFSSINSAGKKLTIEEKVKNYLMKRYPRADRESITRMSARQGFAKVMSECAIGKFCKSDLIYDEFRKVIEGQNYSYETLESFSSVYAFIKNESNLGIFEEKNYDIPIWIRLINSLEVTTADSLLLNWFMRVINAKQGETEKAYELMNSLSRKICVIFFLLYVMDRSGNGKKSANSNFTKCMENLNVKLAPQIINAKADLQYWNVEKNLASRIWNDYILSLPIYDIGQARIKRFILLMLEYMMIDEDIYKEKDWISNLLNQEQLEIEHIFPSSEKKWPQCKQETFLGVSNLNYLINLMLLEGSINKKVKDGMLNEKIKLYKNSKLFMTRHLCELAKDKQYYTKDIAALRIEGLKNVIIHSMEELIKEVNTNVKEVNQDWHLPQTNFELSLKEKSRPNRVTKRIEKNEKGMSKGTANIKDVIIYSTKIFTCQDEKNDTSNVKAIRLKAIDEMVENKGCSKTYKSTISDSIVRRIGINGMAEFDELLKGLWEGNPNSKEKLRSKIRYEDYEDIIKEMDSILNSVAQ